MLQHCISSHDQLKLSVRYMFYFFQINCYLDKENSSAGLNFFSLYFKPMSQFFSTISISLFNSWSYIFADFSNFLNIFCIKITKLIIKCLCLFFVVVVYVFLTQFTYSQKYFLWFIILIKTSWSNNFGVLFIGTA